MTRSDRMQIDYTKLAERLGMGNVRSASNAWGSLRKKMMQLDPKSNLVDPDNNVLVPRKAGPAGNNAAGPPAKKKAPAKAAPKVSRAAGKKRQSEVFSKSDDEDEDAGAPQSENPALPISSDVASNSAASGETVDDTAATTADQATADGPPPAKKRRGRPPKNASVTNQAVKAENDDGDDVDQAAKPAVKKEPAKPRVRVKMNTAPLKKNGAYAKQVTVSSVEKETPVKKSDENDDAHTSLASVPMYTGQQEYNDSTDVEANEHLVSEASEALRILNETEHTKEWEESVEE